jgi:dephospho-CoA kinase
MNPRPVQTTPKRIIVGITGTHGAGKGTAVEWLISKGFKHFSAREFLLKEVVRRGLVPERQNISYIANDLRAKHGASFVLYSLYEEAAASDAHAVIESVYTIGEIDAVRDAARKRGEVFILLAVDADQKTRYERISRRGTSTDHVSYKDFVNRESEEMASTDPAHQNLAACRERADLVLYNNGTKEEFIAQLTDKLRGIHIEI